MNGYGWDTMGSWGWMGMTLMLLIGITLIALIGRTIISSQSGRDRPTPAPPAQHDPAQDALRDRFARGEITAEEYTQRRQVLMGH